MPRKVKPTRPMTREEIRDLAAEVIDERPFIRLDSPADRLLRIAHKVAGHLGRP
jgi:hypothetical protein